MLTIHEPVADWAHTKDSKMAYEKMIADGLGSGLDMAKVDDNFPNDCVLMVRNDVVAELSLEDSGYAPLLWNIAIETLKRAKAAPAAPEDQKHVDQICLLQACAKHTNTGDWEDFTVYTECLNDLVDAGLATEDRLITNAGRATLILLGKDDYPLNNQTREED
jgi:hypothetical protein